MLRGSLRHVPSLRPREQVRSASCTSGSSTRATAASVVFGEGRAKHKHGSLCRGRIRIYRSPIRVSGVALCLCEVTARNLPPPPIPVLSWDACHCWQSGFQDFGFSARYNVFNGGFALTPSVSVGTPSHNYEFRGEAVVGRNLKELQFAVDVGRRLDAISENLSVQGRYSYATCEGPSISKLPVYRLYGTRRS